MGGRRRRGRSLHPRRIGKCLRPGYDDCAREEPRPDITPSHPTTFTFENIEVTKQHHNNTKFRHYLPIDIKGRKCGAVINSGNCWQNVVSEAFTHCIGICNEDLRPLARDTRVTTAEKGAVLFFSFSFVL